MITTCSCTVKLETLWDRKRFRHKTQNPTRAGGGHNERRRRDCFGDIKSEIGHPPAQAGDSWLGSDVSGQDKWMNLRHHFLMHCGLGRTHEAEVGNSVVLLLGDSLEESG